MFYDHRTCSTTFPDGTMFIEQIVGTIASVVMARRQTDEGSGVPAGGHRKIGASSEIWGPKYDMPSSRQAFTHQC